MAQKGHYIIIGESSAGFFQRRLLRVRRDRPRRRAAEQRDELAPP